ncbi:membrane protein insertase YidC [Buchnera aphidicola (Mollitrichosiphum nigrofasciatum)]|uniref:membrane protein insertase YidC n=1 Tax=Buchnera aphidicola TaxID=9 RepID=UPI0031B82BED
MGVKKKFFFGFLCVWILFFSIIATTYKKNTFINLPTYNINNHIDFFFKKIILPNQFNLSKIFVTTDVLKAIINLNDGQIEKLDLLKYKNKLNSPDPFFFLKKQNNAIYVANSFIKKTDIKNKNLDHKHINFISQKENFILNKNNSILSIPIVSYSNKDFIYTKTFIFKKGEYLIEIKHNIKNIVNKQYKFNIFNELQKNFKKKDESFFLKKIVLKPFKGIAYSNEIDKYKKINFEKITFKDNTNILTKSGWISILQKYFLSAWIPNSDGIKEMYIKKDDNNLISIGYISKDILVNSKSQNTVSSFLWIGPKIQDKLSLLANNLDLTIESSFFSFISKPLFNFLNFLYKFTGNWGLAIISITVIIRLMLYPFTKSQYVSMLKMRALQPDIDLIKKKFSTNKLKMSEELLLLYKKKKIHPLSGFLPLLIQMPIFLSLYYMLNSTIELRHAPFFWWIQDLSESDPLYLLPIFMGISMWLVQKNSSNNISDPLQKKIINILPVFFTFFFLWLPSGLVLYYIISNIITIVQHSWIKFILLKK